jgi:hypothetical protein
MLGLCLLMAPMPAPAVPDLRAGETVAGMTVWPDHRLDGLYYHLPGKVRLAEDASGRPRLDLLSTRYVGTAAAGDQGRHDQYNRLSFTVILDPPAASALEATRQVLQSRQRSHVELRPLPVLRMPTRLVYEPIDSQMTEPTPLPRPSLTAELERQSVWTERSYDLRLSAEETELLRSILAKGGVRFSLAYGLVVLAIGNDASLHQLHGSPELVAEMRALLENEPGEADAATPRPLIADADASSITVDLQGWPELVAQVDLNERLPPGFGALEIRCYEFQQAGDNPLFEVRVDVRARTVSDHLLVESVIFSSLEPDRFAARVRFPVAVRLDRPYAFRVTRVHQDGSVYGSAEWIERESWTALLDVTRSTTPAGESSPATPEEFP